MFTHRPFVLLATSIALLNANPSLAQPICKPHLAVKDIRISQLRNLERTWTAAVHVDASDCTDFSGRFEIHFLREKENAPETGFSETFSWHAGELGVGQIEASIDVWVDEIVHDYRVNAAPCACRG